MSLPLDISALPGDVQREFLECRHTAEIAALATAEQAATAAGAETWELGDRRSIEGLGAPVANIPRISFDYWGRRLGYKCWHDKAFVREYLRDVPAARVKAGGTRAQFGYQGKSEVGGLKSEVGNRLQTSGVGRGGSLGTSSPTRLRISYGERVGERALAR